MDKQEAYDIMVAHLREQRAFSFTIKRLENGEPQYRCAYRGKGGVKCAVGCLIPDDVYSKDMENCTPTVGTITDRTRWNWDFAQFLAHAQYSLHDNLFADDRDEPFDLDRFETAAMQFAIDHLLEYQPPITLDKAD